MRIAIIDDELNCRTLIKKHLGQFTLDTDEIAEADTVDSGLNLIHSFKPEIVFLDIQMPDGTGFDLLNRMEKIDFKLIFTTAFDNYAIKAFKYAAIHYLLKPIIETELKGAYLRAKNENTQEKEAIQFLSNYQSEEFKRICLKTEEDFHIIELNQIEFLKAEGSYCNFFVQNKRSILISKPLKEYVEMLAKSDFIRVHKSYLVNIDMIKAFNYRSFEIVLKSEQKIPVSRRSRNNVLDLLLDAKKVLINKKK